MNSTSLNYYHTNVVIPNMILSNKDFFLNNIIKNPENMEYFITKDTYKKDCDRKGIIKESITCELSANNIGGYFIVFATFYKVLITQDSYNLRKLITQIKKKRP